MIFQVSALIQYTYAVRMLRILKLIIVLILGYIQFQSVRVAIGKSNSLGLWFLPIALVILFCTLGI